MPYVRTYVCEQVALHATKERNEYHNDEKEVLITTENEERKTGKKGKKLM